MTNVDMIGGFLVLALLGFLVANIDSISERQLRIITTLGWGISLLLVKGGYLWQKLYILFYLQV